MINLGGKKVAKMLVGSSVIYQDSDGWIPLKLPDGVKGLVMFKDNGNGTASLAGTATFLFTGTGSTSTAVTMLVPPEGYQFESVDWTAGDGNIGIVRGIVCFQSLAGQLSQSNILNTNTINGNLMAMTSNYATGVFNSTVIFTKNSTVKGSQDGSPALINIKNV